MKSTGIIRRIDDIGRITIPKEIRSNMGIKSGDPMELFTEGNSIVIKKYSTTEEAIAGLDDIIEEIKFALDKEDLDFLGKIKQKVLDY